MYYSTSCTGELCIHLRIEKQRRVCSYHCISDCLWQDRATQHLRHGLFEACAELRCHRCTIFPMAINHHKRGLAPTSLGVEPVLIFLLLTASFSSDRGSCQLENSAPSCILCLP